MSSNRRGNFKESQVELNVSESVNLWSIEVLTHLKKTKQKNNKNISTQNTTKYKSRNKPNHKTEQNTRHKKNRKITILKTQHNTTQ